MSHDNVKMNDLLECLVRVSEKAANIARKCRHDEHLFRLLIQEKGTDEANPRFVRDFKTLADVLIQEVVRYDIGTRFPELRESIRGEENNLFSNVLGDSVQIKIGATLEETTNVLIKVLNEDIAAASALAEEVHRTIENSGIVTEIDEEIDTKRVGIWIDPIDSTAEYIGGNETKTAEGLVKSGLKCAAVLIGVFDTFTGSPIAGVVNQPFGNGDESRIFWAFSSHTNVPKPVPRATPRTICVSSSEDPAIVSHLRNHGHQLEEMSGAGYKILTVIEGATDAYILSKNSTYKWDTCGPQAILKSLGGDIVDYTRAVKHDDVTSIDYRIGDDDVTYCNNGGIIAYRDVAVLQEVLKILKDC